MDAGKSICPVCGACSGSTFLMRERVSVHQNIVVDNRDGARALNCVSLNLRCCNMCGFIWNSVFDKNLLAYGVDYNNDRGRSPAFGWYSESILDDISRFCAGIGDCNIVEIGCGDGEFLRALMRRCGNGVRARGYDPSYVGPELEMDGRLEFVRKHFDEGALELKARIVILRHVIEHIDNPISFMRQIRAIVNAGAHLYIETPDVRWILANTVFWDFFYEHCSYFSSESLRLCLSASGFSIKSCINVFGGQYLWVEAVTADADIDVAAGTSTIPNIVWYYTIAEKVLIDSHMQRVFSLNRSGGVAVWGAAAKGVTFCSLIDPDCELIKCVADINPVKQGRFLPGTGHRIVHYRDMPGFGVKTAIVMNPIYADESRMLLERENVNVGLVLI